MYKTHKKTKGVTPLEKFFADILLKWEKFWGYTVAPLLF